jgi:serine/threonine protein kinase
MLTTVDYYRRKEVFLAVCDLPPEELPAALERHCGSDLQLRAAVERLLSLPDLSPPHDRLPEIPGFVIKERLGAGGMGAVYRAEQLALHREVALKLLHGWIAGPGALRLLRREAHLAERVNHPGVARSMDVGTFVQDGVERPFLIMEYVEGPHLHDYPRSRQLSDDEKLALLDKVCDAISSAHSRGVIHRDLKPENIIIDANGHPKLLDFGIADFAEDEELTLRTQSLRAAAGTLQYMAPEQLDPDAGPDVRADIYSLAMIGYEMLAGAPPYDLRGLRMAQAIHVLQNATCPPLHHAGRRFRGDLTRVFEKALQRDPQARYASVAEFAADLQRVRAHEPIVAARRRPLHALAL